MFGDRSTAVRSGFGISVLPQTQINTNLQSQPPNNYTPKVYYRTLSSFLSTADTLFPSNVQSMDWSQPSQSYNLSLGVQRSVGFETVAEAFTGSLGHHLLQTQNLNTLPYGSRFLPQNQDPTTGKPLPDSFLVPYVGLGNITCGQPIGRSSGYALQMQANRRFSHGLEFKSNFTWSKAMDYGPSTTAGENGLLPLYANRTLLACDLAAFDCTFITNLTWLYELPGSSHINNPVLNTAFARWNISGATTLASGALLPITFSPTTGVDLIGGGDGSASTYRVPRTWDTAREV